MNHLKPAEILEATVESGILKAESSLRRLIIMGMMAGAYIAFAGAAANMASFNLLLGTETYGLGKILSGTIFTGGIIMVTLAGAELFTGNSLMTLAVNTGILSSGADMLGAFTVKVAAGKVSMSFVQCVISGILCNWLVCLAVWCSTGAGSTTGKILSLFFPIWLFVTGGFEHSVANMYFISAGIFASSNESFSELSGASAEALANLDWQGMIVDNLLPVTLGNIIGGAFFVATAYWIALKGGKENVR